MNTQTINLDVSKQASVMPVVVIRQGDKNGTNLDVEVFDNGEQLDLTGYDVTLCVLLPDREHNYTVTGTGSGNTAAFTIDETYAGAYLGRTHIAYVEISDTDMTCSTQSFALQVEPTARVS